MGIGTDVGTATKVTLRVPVEMGADARERVTSRLRELTGRDVALDVRVEPSLQGAELLVGRSTRISVDFAEALGGTTTFFKIGRSGLARALDRAKGAPVVLESRTPLGRELVERVRDRCSEAAGREIDFRTHVNPQLESSASLRFGPDLRVDLDLGEQLLAALEAEFAQRDTDRLGSVESTTEYLSRTIARTRPSLHVVDESGRGTVHQVGDGIALVHGLAHVGSQEVVRFESGPYGIAFNLLEGSVGCIMLGSEELIEVGTHVERTGKLLEIPTGQALVGRTVNALGRPVDGKGPVPLENMRPIERVAPNVARRQPVSEPLHTGVKVLDSLVPLGRGQRELILGDRKTGKTALAIDTILSQKGGDVRCVYAAIGQKASSVARIAQIFEQAGAMEYTTLVVGFSSDEPAFRYLVPYAACTIAEEVMDRGGDALVVYDDLSKHAVTYREMSALLKRPIGREAYPGDVFYIHSRLLERAARLRDDLGGGSVTALPIVETLAGDISAFIPTNVISICDGQIMLDSGLFNEGFRPAVDAGLSVSRVGGMAQSAAMKRVAGRLRIDLAQYEEMSQFVKFGAEVDQATLDQLRRGERERELLIQDQLVPLPLEEEITVLFAAVNGYADRVPLSRMRAYEQDLLRYLQSHCPTVLATIRETKELSAASEESLRQAVSQFSREFLRKGTAPSGPQPSKPPTGPPTTGPTTVPTGPPTTAA